MRNAAIQGGFPTLVASTRVRLARNCKGYPYRNLSPAQREQIAQAVWDALQTAPTLSFTRDEIQPNTIQARQLVETHQISPAFAQQGGTLIRSQDESVSIMLGEEDHIRLQVLGTGLCPKECMETATRLADLIQTRVPFDYHEQLGYLTACPSNLGTGLRASVMLHLPALTQSHAIERMMQWAARQGLTVRGAYGEGSHATGDFYQLSNQITLGLSEDTILQTLISAASQVIAQEKQTREQLRAANPDAFLDRIARAAATLQFAHLLPSSEAAHAISQVLVGLQMGDLSGATPQDLIATLQETAALSGTPQERDRLRAQAFRKIPLARVQP